MTTVDALTPSPTAIDAARARTAMLGLLSNLQAHRASRHLARASPTQRVAAIMAFLMTGIAIAILTTPDHLWWQLHFSQLGTFSAFSSYVFNATLLTSGVSIVAFSRFLHRELALHVARSGSRRRSPRVISTLIGSVGVHLAGVGGIPVNTWTFMHDRAATGMVFSFLLCLIVAPFMLRGVGRPLAAMTLPAALLLVGGGTSMVIGIINLAAFELIGFATMFTWMLLFVACLGRHASATALAKAARANRPARECTGDRVAPSRRIRLRTTSSAGPAAVVTHAASSRDAATAPHVTCLVPSARTSSASTFHAFTETYAIPTDPRRARSRMMRRRSQPGRIGPAQRRSIHAARSAAAAT
jgi:hypothetical membrane protein